MLKKAILFLLILFLTGFWNTIQSQEIKEESEKALLNQILKKTGEYCERLKRMAFDFVCHENIKETTYFYKKTTTYKLLNSATPLLVTGLKFKNKKMNSYVYDYQMIKKGDKKEERRILLNENGKERYEENAELKFQRFKAKFLVYGPVGFLSKYWQQYFKYEITGRDNVDSKNAIVISAIPMAYREENYNFGKIWLDEKDFSILKIEWDPRSIINFTEKVPSTAGELKRTLTWTVSYGVEKNEVRFPSKQLIEEIFMSQTDRKHPKYIVSVNYGNYKFFTVETEIELRKKRYQTLRK